jgi:hypothetical protein
MLHKKIIKKKEREKEIDVYGASAGLLVIVNSLFIPGRVPEASPPTHFLLKSWDNRTQQLKGSGTNPFPLSHLFILCGIGQKKKTGF